MKKKGILLVVMLLLLFLLLGACSGESTDQSATNATAEETETEGVAEETAQTEETEEEQETITETVLLDESGIKITAKSLDLDGIFGPELTLNIENNSGQNLTFQCRGASVNGYMVETSFSADVVNGKKANDGIVFSDTDLDLSAIDTIATIEFSFHIFHTDSWDTYLDSAPVSLSTSAAASYTDSFDPSGDLLYEGNGIRMVSQGYLEEDSLFGPSLKLYVENNSDQPITIQTRDTSVNGYMVETIFSADVAPGKRIVDTVTFSSSSLEENGITSIDTTELSFHIFQTDTWDTIVDTEAISIP